jgi:hypothetical protein
MITALALLAVASLLLVVTMGAVAQSQKSGKLENVNPADMDTMYHTVVMTGMNSESLTFNVLNSVVKNKDAAFCQGLLRPQPVQHFYANDTLMFMPKTDDAGEPGIHEGGLHGHITSFMPG